MVPNYDKLAPYYDFLSRLVFRGQLQKAQECFIGKLISPGEILVFGGGTGQLLETLCLRYPKANICYLEASENMISKAKARLLGDNAQVQFVRGTEQKLVGKQQVFDAIITPFVLDSFNSERLKDVLELLWQSLIPGGRWIQTDFYKDDLNSWWQYLLIWLMYQFFRVTAGQQNTRLPDFTGFFSQYPLRLLAMRTYFHGMVRATLYEKIHEMDPSHSKK